LCLARAASTDAPVGTMASAAVMPACLPIVEKSVFRFDESESARKEAAPSVSFADPRVREEEIDTTSFESNKPEYVPVFEKDGVHQIVTLKVSYFRITFQIFVHSSPEGAAMACFAVQEVLHWDFVILL
jgi:hypothetical protein